MKPPSEYPTHFQSPNAHDSSSLLLPVPNLTETHNSNRICQTNVLAQHDQMTATDKDELLNKVSTLEKSLSVEQGYDELSSEAMKKEALDIEARLSLLKARIIIPSPPPIAVNRATALKIEAKIRPQRSIKQGNNVSLPSEHRGISVNQLMEVVEIIKKRCNVECWKSKKIGKCLGKLLDPGDVTLYDLDYYLITPYTKKSNLSYVEYIAKGPQKPGWYVSHWWGGSVMEFVHCIRQHAIDHGYSFENHYYWICAYANNQNDLGSSNLDKPLESSFGKAINATGNKVLSIMDPDAVVYGRIWCCFEISIGLNGIYEVYTVPRDKMRKAYAYDIDVCKDHIARRKQGVDRNSLWEGMKDELKESPRRNLAVGITEGIAFIDGDETLRYPSMKQFRESHFPLEPLMKIMSMDVEQSESSKPEDKERILGCIEKQHGSFEKFNTNLKGKFIASSWKNFLENEVEMEKYANVLGKSNIKNISLSLYGCKQFDDDALKMLSDNLPTSVEKFELEAGGTENSREDSDYLLTKLLSSDGENAERCNNLREIILVNSGLKREIPREIVKFTELKCVRLELNDLEGKIPEDIGKCTKLVDFYVFGNPRLTGGIPKSIGKLKNLKRFCLGHSNHDGEIPKEFGNCSDIELIFMGNNDLTGPLTPIGELTKLHLGFFNDNHFSGEIPATIGNCSNLNALFLHNNDLEGELPKELLNCRKLKTLSLYGNDKLDASSFQQVLSQCNLATLYIDKRQKLGLERMKREDMDDPMSNLARTVRVISNNDYEFNYGMGWDIALAHLDIFNEF